jgi:cytoskeletal protein CcmA (bactofilin family)
MFGRNAAKARSARPSKSDPVARPEEPTPAPPTTLLAIVGQQSRVEGKFDVADSIEIECEIGGELTVGGHLVIGEHGVVTADVHAVGAVIKVTGRVSGNIETDSLVSSQGGFFNGNVAKIREHDVHSGPRPVHLVEDKRLGAQK